MGLFIRAAILTISTFILIDCQGQNKQQDLSTLQVKQANKENSDDVFKHPETVNLVTDAKALQKYQTSINFTGWRQLSLPVFGLRNLH